jgi:hypothetical protein
VGKWELIIAVTIFAVNGLLGYLAKREKEKARRQAEAEAAGLPPTRPPEPAQVRVDPAAAGGTRRTAPPPPPVPPRAKRPGGSTAQRGGVPAGRGKAAPKPAARGRIQTPPAKPAKSPKSPKAPTPATARSEPSPRPVVPAAPVSASAARRQEAATVPADRMRQGLRDPRSLREAIVWAEVLGRPRGLDPAGDSGF